MDTADDRLRSAVLVGVTLAVVAVGGWWWWAAAPVPTAGSAGPPTAEPSVSTETEGALASGVPDARVMMRLDDVTGDAVRAVVDPATGAITDIQGDPSMLFPAGDLPLFHQTIWREQRELTPGQGVTRQSTSANDGARYLLQYRCTRPGTLAVTSTGAEITGPPRIDCDGTIASAEVMPGSGPFRVSLSAIGGQPIDVQAQLVALPR
ncbi:hypothetical protein [Micromonospora sp. 067-2]|uniref:hypothetical protein n=1 Tax=Micromonospora sp. 067-2 TaxID=2789270 RepID=UPI00397A8AE3